MCVKPEEVELTLSHHNQIVNERVLFDDHFARAVESAIKLGQDLNYESFARLVFASEVLKEELKCLLLS